MRSSQYRIGLGDPHPAQHQVSGQREREVVPQCVADTGLQGPVRRFSLLRDDGIAELERDLEQQHRADELRFGVLGGDGLRKVGLLLESALPPVGDLRPEHHELGGGVLVPTELSHQVRAIGGILGRAHQRIQRLEQRLGDRRDGGTHGIPAPLMACGPEYFHSGAQYDRISSCTAGVPSTR